MKTLESVRRMSVSNLSLQVDVLLTPFDWRTNMS
jgi:hypothetical protein